jgi:hypothetical protein
MPYSQYDLVDATFNPRRTDDLRLGSAAWMGHRTTWQAIGEIEEGPDKGQMAFSIEVGIRNAMRDRGEALPPFTWVREDDLEIHSVVERGPVEFTSPCCEVECYSEPTSTLRKIVYTVNGMSICNCVTGRPSRIAVDADL